MMRVKDHYGLIFVKGRPVFRCRGDNPIDDQHAFHTILFLRIFCGDRNVVINAETHAARWSRVMPGRTDGAEGVPHLLRHDGIHGIQYTHRWQVSLSRVSLER
jgi:hypothetical protein